MKTHITIGRFREGVSLSIGGQSVTLSLRDARKAFKHLGAVCRSIEREAFSDATVHQETFGGGNE